MEAMAVDRFAVARHELPAGVVGLELVGEVDLAVSHELTTAVLREIATPGVGGLVVDLRQVTFLDSTGISALVAGMRAAGHRGIPSTVSNAHGMVRSVLDVTGVQGPLTDPDQALPAPDPVREAPGQADT
jgi:anti-anti-sigma factor